MRRKTLGILASLQARNSLQFNALLVLFRQKRTDEMPVVHGHSHGKIISNYVISIPFAHCVREGMEVERCIWRRFPVTYRIMKTPPPEATKTVYPILRQIVNLILPNIFHAAASATRRGSTPPSGRSCAARCRRAGTRSRTRTSTAIRR